MERRKYLQKNSVTGKYCFGLKLAALSRAALENLDLREQAKPFLYLLMQNTGLTVHMAILERDDAVIIEKVEAPGMLRLATWVGRRLDVNSSGVGKALLASLAEDELAMRCKAKSLAKHNEHTIASLGKLKQELALIRAQGYALDNEEDEIGFRCVGVPILDSNKRVVAAISVAGTTTQISMEKVKSLAAYVQRAARNISLHVGHIDTVP